MIKTIESLDEFGLAERVMQKFGDRLRFLVDASTLLAWDGTRYCRQRHVAEALVKDVVEHLGEEFDRNAITTTADGEVVTSKDFDKFLVKARSKGMIEKAIWHLRLNPESHCKLADFDADSYKLNCANGLLDMQTGLLAPHSPDQLVTKIAPISWNPEKDCPKWTQFIKEITVGDADLAAYLQRLFGYCLSGSTQEEVLPILHGCGANGKSIFLARLRAILGPEYSLTLGTGSILNSRFHGIRCDLRQLEGVRAAFAIEVNKGQALDESVVKSLTGGDEISARAMRENPVQFKPKAKILMAVNHLPGFVGNDNGIHRRLQIVPFLAKFTGERRKEEIEAEFAAEAVGILDWAVQGFQAWLEKGLEPPQCVRNATEKYFADNDQLADFLEERTTSKPEKKVPVRMLFESYFDWATNSCIKPLGLHQFGELMRSRGFIQVRDKAVRYWSGLALRAG